MGQFGDEEARTRLMEVCSIAVNGMILICSHLNFFLTPLAEDAFEGQLSPVSELV